MIEICKRLPFIESDLSVPWKDSERQSFSKLSIEAQDLVTDICDFIESLNDDYLTLEPWQIFHAWMDRNFDKSSAEIEVFRCWQLFHWRPDPHSVLATEFGDHSITLSQFYLRSKARNLSALQKQLIQSLQMQDLDLYSIKSVIPGQGLRLEGTLDHAIICVFNPALSLHAQVGEIMLGQSLAQESLGHILVGSSRRLKPSALPKLQQFRQFVKRCESSRQHSFVRFESDIFNFFYDLAKDHSQKPSP